jgi:PPP family 3-phenylpropionic acid transporter
MKRFATPDVLAACFALGVARFALIGWGVDSAALLVVAQLLHGATFGACHVASLALVNRWFSGRRQVRGQALYLSISFGVGGFIGAAASGAAWDAVGPAWTFTGAAAAAAVGLLVIVRQAKLLRRLSGRTSDAATPG